MMSGLVPTTTMCWAFSWDMGSFGGGSEQVLAGAGREEGAQALEGGGVERLGLVEDVDRVLVGDHDEAAGTERDHRAAVHARHQGVLGVELERRADRGDPLVVQDPLEAGPGAD